MSVATAPLELREIQGPSAYGGGWRRFLHLTWLIASTDFKLTYFGSVLGYLWSLMRPLLFFGVLYVVFAKIIRFGSGIRDYPMILLLNIVLFSFFQEATQTSITSVLDRENLVRKMHFPRLVIPLAAVTTAALNMGVNLIAVFVFLLVYGVEPRLTWLLLPVLVVPLMALTAGVAMILSSLYVRYRDVAPIWSVVGQVLFYGAPILYTVDRVPAGWVRTAYASNPITALLVQARRWIVDGAAPSAASVVGGLPTFLIPIALGTGIVALGLWLFHRAAPGIAEEL